MEIKKYRKKPVVIEAIQWNGNNMQEIHSFAGDKAMFKNIDKQPVLILFSHQSTMVASVTDMIIKGINGEFYPCNIDIFKKTYDNI